MNRSQTVALLVAVVLLILIQFSASSNAASANEFSITSNALSAAYSATYHAQQSGGNVSSLVSKLNVAVGLYQRALSENASNAAQASADLKNATQIAQQVISESRPIAQTGASGQQIQRAESIGSAIVIVAIAVLLYIYGGGVYRRIWLFLYKSYVVRPVNG